MVTVRVTGLETFPAWSLAVIAIVFEPVASACVSTGVTDQVPSDATVVVSTTPPGSVTRIVSPAAPVPAIVGVVSFVRSSPAIPESEDAAIALVGADGAVASTVIVTLPGAELLPDESVAVT